MDEERGRRAEILEAAFAEFAEKGFRGATIKSIAEAAGVSERGLLLAFRRVLGTTPAVYVRRARLDAVRRELQAAQDGTTVAVVARRWGFAHLGRFAGYYREEFGELPGATLRD